MVELLVALTVTLIGLAGLMAMFTTAAKANGVASDSSEAVDACAAAVEELRSMSVAEIEALPEYGAITSDGWGPVPYHGGDLEGRRGVELQRSLYAKELTGMSSSLVWLKVEVAWTDPGAAPGGASDHSVSFELIRTREDRL